jgi:hypothetical protein
MMAMAGSMAALGSEMISMGVERDFNRPKTRKTGKTYPHCSARQQARYTRQLAAGQISFITHGPRAA